MRCLLQGIRHNFPFDCFFRKGLERLSGLLESWFRA